MPLRFARHENLLNLGAHVRLIKHLIALIENEGLKVVKHQILLLDESQHATGSTDHDVRRFEALENFFILADRNSAKDGLATNIGKILGEAVELVLDLDSELACIAQDQCANRLRIFLQLVEQRENEHGGLAHAGDGLANNVASLHRIGNALLLDFRRVLETAVNDGAIQFFFQQEIFEAGGVDACRTCHPGVVLAGLVGGGVALLTI